MTRFGLDPRTVLRQIPIAGLIIASFLGSPREAPAGVVLAVPDEVLGDASDPDGDGLTNAEEAQLGTNPMNPDSDGDGLLDGWEVRGYTYGDVTEPLDAWGCDPLRKDVLVEIDWMLSESGDPAPNAAIVFAAALDVWRVFRDSGTGIRIHFDLGSEISRLVPEELLEEREWLGGDFQYFTVAADRVKTLAYQDSLRLYPTCPGRSPSVSLYDAYRDATVFRPSRRPLFYYVVFAEAYESPDEMRAATTGVTTHFADETARRLGLRPTAAAVSAFFHRPIASIPSARTRRFHYAASLLHELGHAFGLGHGGVLRSGLWDNTDRKPNYPSVMNRRFQFWGIATRRTPLGEEPVLDFSHGGFIAVDERRIVEADGLGPVPHPHILHLLAVEHLNDSPYKRNIDWNRNGTVDPEPLAIDLNQDDTMGKTPLADHDDWAWLARNGFNGIGANASRCGGSGCGAGDALVRVPADFDGDGMSDLLVLEGGGGALFLARDGGLAKRPHQVFDGGMGGWSLLPADEILVLDLDGTPGDELFLRRGAEAAVLDFAFTAGLERIWPLDPKPVPPEGAAQSPDGWRFEREDEVEPLQSLASGAAAILVSRPDLAAVLQLEASKLAASWQSSRPLRDWTDGEDATISRGRQRAGHEAALLVRSAHALVEIDALSGALGARHDDGGVLPAAEGVGAGWQLSAADCFLPLDLDGDGTGEYVVLRPGAMGVLREAGGRLLLEWSGADPLARALELSIVSGPFLDGGGDELVLIGEAAVVALRWNVKDRSLDVVARAVGSVETPGAGRWTISAGQTIHSGKLLPDRGAVLLVEEPERVLVVGVDPGGFRVLRAFDGVIAGWPLTREDHLQLVNLDADPELELSLRRGRQLGFVDLSPTPRLVLAVEITPDSFELAPLARFRRGDTNHDGEVDISDPIAVLEYLFLGRLSLACAKAADADDNGVLEISDAIRVLLFLFSAGPPPAPPGPSSPGVDATDDSLPCGG